MPVVWNNATDRKLFLSILKEQSVKVDSKAVATALSADGIAVTPRAVEERMKKLRKLAQEDKGTSDSANDDPATPGAAAGRKRDSGEGDDEANDSPKPKKAIKPTKAKTKAGTLPAIFEDVSGEA